MSNAKNQEHQSNAVNMPEENGVWTQKRRLAAAMRKVIELLVTTEAPEDELCAAADRLERYARRLETQAQRHITWGSPEASIAGTTGGFFDLSPLIGLANPLAPPITLWVDGNVVRGKVVFGWAYQGPPGYVHGGFVAALFDETLGFAQSMLATPGMTGTLTVRYRKPTPLYTELRIEATVQRVDGRKIFTEARLYAGETLTAEAEAIFISLSASTLDMLAQLDKAKTG
ncbi:MAG: PaaI family thioesterase [Candidatus Binatia bacterium]